MNMNKHRIHIFVLAVVFVILLGVAAYSAAAEKTELDRDRGCLAETDEAVDPDIYIDIPDSMFPIPMLDGVVIPYEWCAPPEEGYEVTSYVYVGESFMESYKEQLQDAGFVDNGSVGWIESLWRYEREEDGATLIVEMFHEDERFVINMYVNYLG